VNSFVWDLPGVKDHPVANAVLGNWRLSGITTLQSGRPFSVGSSNNPTAGAGGARADLVGEGYPVLDSGRSKGERLNAYFDKTRFVNASPNTFGTLGRNALFGPGFANVDISLTKSWPLIALVGAPFVIGLAEVWHVVLLAVGVALLVVEIAFFAGFGLFGVTGIALMLMGLVLAVVPTGGDGWVPLPDPAVMGRLQQSAMWTMLGLIAALAAIVAVTRSLERVPLLNRLILTDAQRAAAAGAGGRGIAGDPAVGGWAREAHVAGDDDLGGGRLSVGDAGQTATALRPTGRARFGDREVDVTTTGQWLEAGQAVRIAEISGNLILVDAIDA
jgi:hypothetical protein